MTCLQRYRLTAHTSARPHPGPQAQLSRILAIGLLALAVGACDQGTAVAPEVSAGEDAPADLTTVPLAQAPIHWQRVVARIRASTARYHDSDVAIAEGFQPVSGCVEAPGVGGMGYHYLHPDRLGDAIVDPELTEVLLYEPQGERLRLVGVEFLVVADAWDAVESSLPSLLGVTFDEHRGAATHGLPFDHYELHVWTWRHNRAGLTAPFNPKVSCDDA